MCPVVGSSLAMWLCRILYDIGLRGTEVGLKRKDVQLLRKFRIQFKGGFENVEVGGDLKDDYVGNFSGIVGVVTRLSKVFQHLLEVKYTCNKCTSLLGSFLQKLSTAEVVGRSCSHCQSEGPFTVIREKTVYSRYQKLTLQSRHYLVSPTTAPISIEVILLDELIGCARLGQEIVIPSLCLSFFSTTVISVKSPFPFANIQEITVPSIVIFKFLQNILDLYFKYFKLPEDVVNRILQVVLDLQHFKSSLFIFAATILQSSSAIHHISNIDNFVHQIIKFQSILITSSHSLWSSQSFGHQKAINGFDMPLPVAVCSGLVNPLAPRK
ncbi:DNA replication licensing factor MCM2, partial [Tanacetum coccineum]